MVRDARDWDLLTRPDGLSCDLYLPRDVYRTALAIVQGDRASREAIVALTVLDALLWRQAATTAVLSPST